MAGGGRVSRASAPGEEVAQPDRRVAGDPTAGVQISEEDAAAAVPGDTGPENPGVR